MSVSTTNDISSINVVDSDSENVKQTLIQTMRMLDKRWYRLWECWTNVDSDTENVEQTLTQTLRMLDKHWYRLWECHSQKLFYSKNGHCQWYQLNESVKHRRRWCQCHWAIPQADSLWGCRWARECCLATRGHQLCEEEKNSCCRAWSAVIRVNGFMSNSFFSKSYAESGMLAHDVNASFSLSLSPSFCAACWLAAGPARSLVHRTFRSTGLLPGWHSKCFPEN